MNVGDAFGDNNSIHCVKSEIALRVSKYRLSSSRAQPRKKSECVVSGLIAENDLFPFLLTSLSAMCEPTDDRCSSDLFEWVPLNMIVYRWWCKINYRQRHLVNKG